MYIVYYKPFVHLPDSEDDHRTDRNVSVNVQSINFKNVQPNNTGPSTNCKN